MTISRFEIRPVASRRLRATLLLVFLLALFGVGQTRLTGVELAVALLALTVIFADGLRRTRVPACTLVFEDRPRVCRLIDDTGAETRMRGIRASVYPWLIVLRLEVEQGSGNPQEKNRTGAAQNLPAERWLRYPVVFLPDSLNTPSKDGWRYLLVWSQQLRRTLANT